MLSIESFYVIIIKITYQLIYSIGERLERIADKLYKSNKSDFARAINKKPQNVYQYIRGDRTPGAEFLYQLTTIGVNVNWVLTGKGEMLEKDQKSSVPLASSAKEEHVGKLLTSITNRLNKVDFDQETKIGVLKETLDRIDAEQNNYFVEYMIKA